MSVSKKLSIAQLILAISAFVFFIIAIISVTSMNMSFGSIISGGIFSIISVWVIPVALLIIGIIQIVFFTKEKPGGVYLASGIFGIVSILSFLPFLNFAIWLTIIILSIICIVKK